MTKEADDFLSECRKHKGGKPSDALRTASGAFIGQAKTSPAMIAKVCETLPSLPFAGASWLAIVLGALVEDSGSAKESIGPLVSLFLSWEKQLPEVTQADEEDEDSEDDYPEPTEKQAEIIDAIPFLCQALVAHLARAPEYREKLAGDAALIDRLEDLSGYSHGFSWLKELLIRESGMLTLLFVQEKQGFKIKYENVGNCFHLISLIQHVLGNQLPKGGEVNEAVAAAAQGETQDDMSDAAWWHYGDPRSPTPELLHSIFGESYVSDIPLIDGERIILVWPPILKSRSWDAGFYGVPLAAAKPSVSIIETLDQTQCHTWFETLGIEARS